MKTRLLFAALAALVIATVAGATGASAAGEHLNDGPKSKNTAGISKDCVNEATNLKEGTFTYVGPTSVWPPNHKYVTARVTLTDEDAETALDDVTVAVGGTHDQLLADGQEMNGSGNTDPATDVLPGAGAGKGSATAVFRFRAERSGRDKTGRTYTFTANGTTDSGTSKCKPVTFTAVVPHDQRAGSR